jgi:hypothetical protein
MSYNPSIVNNNTYYAGLLSSGDISITAAVSATIKRMHVISGTSADYTITLPVSPAVDSIIGFRVQDYSLANKKFKLDAGVGVIICGRTRYITLLHTNVLLLIWNGTLWQPLVINLDTPWIGDGLVLIKGTVSDPTKGTTSVDSQSWRRVGDSIHCKKRFRQTGAGTAGSGNLLLQIPFSAVVDTTKFSANSGYTTSSIESDCGKFSGAEAGYNRIGFVFAYNSTNVGVRTIIHLEGGGSTGSGPESASLTDAARTFSCEYTLPVLDW